MTKRGRDRFATLGCLVALLSVGVALPITLGSLAILGSDIQWLMFKPYIIIFPLAIVSLLLGFWKPSFGGVIFVITGLGTIVGTFTDNIITFGLEPGVFILLPLELIIGSVLIMFGFTFIKYVPPGLVQK